MCSIKRTRIIELIKLYFGKIKKNTNIKIKCGIFDKLVHKTSLVVHLAEI